MMNAFYASTPPWLLTILLFILLVLMLALGAFLRRRKIVTGREEPDDEHTFENLTASAVLGLLALLLGFSFALALDRFDLRRSMTLEEANAIRSMYVRTQLMDEPYKARFHRLLIGYTEHRIRIAGVADSDDQRALSLKTEAYRRQMVATGLEAIRPMYNSEFGTAFTDSMNETLNIGSARKAARLATIPPRVLNILLIYMAITAVIVGFVKDQGKGRWAAAVLLLMLAISYGLIIDIDQPNRGGIREGQVPMQDVLQSIKGG
jgi:hypothetical protein